MQQIDYEAAREKQTRDKRDAELDAEFYDDWKIAETRTMHNTYKALLEENALKVREARGEREHENWTRKWQKREQREKRREERWKKVAAKRQRERERKKRKNAGEAVSDGSESEPAEADSDSSSSDDDRRDQTVMGYYLEPREYDAEVYDAENFSFGCLRWEQREWLQRPQVMFR
jgi:hypothetical protein